MSMASDAGGLLVTAVGVGVVAKAVQKSSKKFKKGWGKGFYGETLKHSENARKASYSEDRYAYKQMMNAGLKKKK